MDELFNEEPNINDVNIFDFFLTESIIQASEPDVSHKCPWTNDEFLSVIEKRRNSNDPSTLRELGTAIKKMRNKLKMIIFRNWQVRLIPLVKNGRKNAPLEYLKSGKEAKETNTTVPEPDDLNWAYVFNDEKLRTIIRATSQIFVKPNI